MESVGSASCYGLELEMRDARDGGVHSRWALDPPIAEQNSEHRGYREILERCTREFSIERIVVSTLLGHSLETLRTELPTTFVYHDSATFCPALFATRWRPGVAAWEECRSCPAEHLRECVSRHPGHRPLNRAAFYEWMRDEFFSVATREDLIHVAPTRGLPDRLRRLDPRFSSVPFQVVEHGIDLPRRDCFGGAEEGRRLRIGMLGSLTWNKGRKAVLDSFERLRLVADLYFLGAHEGADPLVGRRDVTVLHAYDPDELPAILETVGLDAMLFLPVVPESFSFTLSESWGHGIPVLARKIGAHAERIEDGHTGFLFDDDTELLDVVLRLDRDRSSLRRVAGEIANRPLRTSAEATRELMDLRPLRSEHAGLGETETSTPRRGSRCRRTYESDRVGVKAFTSAAPNYLGKVLALGRSLRRHCPTLEFHWVVADRKDPSLLERDSIREVVDGIVFAEELSEDLTPDWLFQHDLVELSTAIKPIAATRLLGSDGCEGLLYLDPDLVIFSGLRDVLTSLSEASVLLTPHLLEPESELEAIIDHELCALRHGVFNLGFLGLRACDEAFRFLQWWSDRCREFCWRDVDTGTFTDQKWINFAPVFFSSSRVLRSPRLNVAPWNLNQRKLTGSFDDGFFVEGEPLGFYHFTGFDSGAHRAMVEKYAPGNRSAEMLVDWYGRTTRDLGELPWRLGFYADGSPIHAIHRAIYRARPDLRAAFPLPYGSRAGGCDFLSWLRFTGPTEYPELSCEDTSPASSSAR